METPYVNLISQRLLFDPNHCGMETSFYQSNKTLFPRLIRTIVGWKHERRTSPFIPTPFDPNHCGMETNVLGLGNQICYLSLIRTIVGWKLMYKRAVLMPEFGLIRTIVGWKRTGPQSFPTSMPPV